MTILIKSCCALCCLLTLLSGSAGAAAKINIVTTTSDLADITRSITGDIAEVTSIASGREDPHFLSARPSFIVRTRDADVWIRIGMDLEIGWEPVILRDSRIYGYLAMPSSVPITSPRRRSPGQPCPPSGRGASVCNQ